MEEIDNLKHSILFDKDTGFLFDYSMAGVSKEALLSAYGDKISVAVKEMHELEAGSLANPDEQRMVGHYWLRDSAKSPDGTIREQIQQCNKDIYSFVHAVKTKEITASGREIKHLILAGIGGSALGPQLLEASLKKGDESLAVHYLDNTDPAGMVDTIAAVKDLSASLCLVVSKSGGTRETRNSMLWLERCFKQHGLNPSNHFVAVTSVDSALDKYAVENKWLARFPMWDWVGGRVSLWSAVGVLPASLMGIDTEGLLAGAKHMDALTLRPDLDNNPALLLATIWYELGKGRGEKILVMLPYRDQLEKFSKYLQQLVMESLGKAENLAGEKVNQGLYVMGNKGSTDQHSYVQQLRDGLDNFIAHFIEVRSDHSSLNPKSELNLLIQEPIEHAATAGDYLLGFEHGTRQALYEAKRANVLISVETLNAHTLGMLLALFERAVGYYASFINVNAYHQPGVEAGKKAAGRVIDVQEKIVSVMSDQIERDLQEVVIACDLANEVSTVFAILRHFEATGRMNSEGQDLFARKYKLVI